MSAFALNRKYELALPTGYVDIDNEEMEYVDGGVSAKKRWYGVQINLSGREAEGLAWALATGSGAAWLAAELTSPTVIGGISFGVIAAAMALSAGAVGGLNWLKRSKGVSFNYSFA